MCVAKRQSSNLRLAPRLTTTLTSVSELLGVSEHFQRQFDTIILYQQLHSRRSAFHAQAYTDDDGGYASSVQRNPRQICFFVG